MNKSIVKSKTVWGFGIVGIIALGTVTGIPLSESLTAEIIQILAGLFGLFGLRDAVA